MKSGSLWSQANDKNNVNWSHHHDIMTEIPETTQTMLYNDFISDIYVWSPSDFLDNWIIPAIKWYFCWSTLMIDLTVNFRVEWIYQCCVAKTSEGMMMTRVCLHLRSLNHDRDSVSHWLCNATSSNWAGLMKIYLSIMLQ